MIRSYLSLVIVTAAVGSSSAWADRSDWAEGTESGTDGATRDYYNRAALLPWNHFMGDWRDADDVAQGNTPYATAHVVDDDTGKFVEWDVTTLVRQWLTGDVPNQGFFLRPLAGGGKIVLSSREDDQPDRRPSLVITGPDTTIELAPVADTFLTKSTYRSQGTQRTLTVSSEPEHGLLRFDLARVKSLGDVSKATLRLYTTRQYGSLDIGVFRCRQGHDVPPSEPRLGLASRYPNDQGISDDPKVIFATGFESDDWHKQWSYAGKMDVIGPVSEDPARHFEPLLGRSLRVKIAKGAHLGLNTLYKFERETGREPEEIYFRYYLRLGSDWNQTIQGGKMPGISGTYGVAGWGGRKVDGTNGWSARGSFFRSIPQNNPLGGLHPIGTYCYHADMKGTYGDSWVWNRGYGGYLENNRWYSVEQYLKLNTPDERDGVFRAWIDGRLAFEKTDIRFRAVDRLKIEQIWMNVYHGGKLPSPHDQHLFIDNVIIATDYIGPLGLTRPR